jgi:medium-chain acyl-[acyl-carrier-protein] hydrolase
LNAAGPALAEALREPFILLGHSAGAVVAFALARWLEDHAGLRACKLLAAGSPAPHASCPWLNDLPDLELRQQLEAMGGTPAELLAHNELMELLAPTLRADLRVTETYCSNDRIHCPIAAFGGSTDSLATREQLLEWRVHTSSSFSLTMVPGDHFFIRQPSVVMPYLVHQMTLD